LIINVKMGKALGLTITASLLQRAAEVIQRSVGASSSGPLLRPTLKLACPMLIGYPIR
jgi:hypothetical protein